MCRRNTGRGGKRGTAGCEGGKAGFQGGTRQERCGKGGTWCGLKNDDGLSMVYGVWKLPSPLLSIKPSLVVQPA